MPVASSGLLTERPPRSFTSESNYSSSSVRSRYRPSSDYSGSSSATSSVTSSYTPSYRSRYTTSITSKYATSTSSLSPSRSTSSLSSYSSRSTSPSRYSSDYSGSTTISKYAAEVASRHESALPPSASRYSSSRTSVLSSPQLTRRRDTTGASYDRGYQTLPRTFGISRTRETSPISTSGRGTLSEVSSPRSYSPSISRRSSRTDLYGGTTSNRYSRSGSICGDDVSGAMGEGTPAGLRNLGNTCFMNSVIQCIYRTRPLQEYLVNQRYQSDINTTTSTMKGDLVKHFANLLKELATTDSTAVSSLEFKRQIERFAPRFTGYSQQDAQEFLRYLVFGIHEDVNRVTGRPPIFTTDIDDSLSDAQKAVQAWKRYTSGNDSKMVDLFVGQLKSTLTCTHCGYKSVTFDPFWDLSLPIPRSVGRVTINQCLASFVEEERLDGDEKPTCSRCKERRVCTKSFNIHKLPEILVLHLKRFSPGERYRSKLSNLVEFPVDSLDVSRFVSDDCNPSKYRLYAVSNHRGTPLSGHYTAFCKRHSDGQWHLYDDTRVTTVNDNDIVKEDAYILFYETSGRGNGVRFEKSSRSFYATFKMLEKHCTPIRSAKIEVYRRNESNKLWKLWRKILYWSIIILLLYVLFEFRFISDWAFKYFRKSIYPPIIASKKEPAKFNNRAP